MSRSTDCPWRECSSPDVVARFDVYRAARPGVYLLDVQSDWLDTFGTRLVVPLLGADVGVQPVRRLHPRFEVEGSSVLMATQFIAAVPSKKLRKRISNLAPQAAEVQDAIDFLHQGW